MLNQHQKDFLKALSELERSEGLRSFEAYRAFLELAFCAMVKATMFGNAAEAIEARYMKQISRFRHPTESAAACKRALAHLVEGLEAEAQDFLGVIHMEVAANKHTGQFFTPWALCMVASEMTAGNPAALVEGGRILTVSEPASGCGGMVLAFAEVLKRGGVNPAAQAHFDLTDVDLGCAQAAYLQCNLMGISATVRHGNTLSRETWGEWQTITAFLHPKRCRIAAQQREDAPPPPAVADKPARPSMHRGKPLQLSLL